MAREIFTAGVQYTEDGEEEYFVQGVQVNEDQAAAADDIAHVAALADSFDNVVQRRPIKVTNF